MYFIIFQLSNLFLIFFNFRNCKKETIDNRHNEYEKDLIN